MRPRIQLVFQNHPIPSSSNQLMHPRFRQHSGNEDGSYPQELAKSNLGLEFLVFHITQCIFDFDSVHLPVFFKNKVKVLSALCPTPAPKLPRVPTTHDELTSRKTFKHHEFTVQPNHSTDIRIGVLLHEAYQPSGPPTVKPVTTMPHKIYGTPRFQRPRFAQDKALIPQV